jgi:hypothetical protein
VLAPSHLRNLIHPSRHPATVRRGPEARPGALRSLPFLQSRITLESLNFYLMLHSGVVTFGDLIDKLGTVPG